MSVAPSATGWPAGQALLPNKVAPSPGGGMLPRGQALRSAPHTLSVGGRAAPRSLRASSPRAPTPARAAAHDPDKALAKNASKKFDPTVSSRFFNREFEFKYLNTLFDGNPRDIILLTGPQNCGKTALAQHIMGWRAARQAADVEGPPPVLYLDCRAKDMSTPAELAKHLREIVTGNPSIVTLVTKMLQTVKSLTAKQGAVTFSVDVDAMFSEHRDVTPVASVIASYTELLDLFKASRYKPIIFIDEANVLQGWREAGVGAPELEKLLRFFVKITKQDNAAHVVLATSSSFLEGWLRGQGLDAKQFRVHVVGDLPEDEAQRYFCGGGGWPGLIMQSAADVPPGGLEAWPKVYAACGGNIGLLLRCVEGAKVEGDWDEAVQSIMEAPATAVADGLDLTTMPIETWKSAPKWTPDQFKTVLRLIARAPHHAVLAGKVAAALGEHGSEALLSLVGHNLLALRARSKLARDLPPEVYEGKRGGRVVVMPSPAELYYVMELYKAGELGEEAGGGGVA